MVKDGMCTVQVKCGDLERSGKQVRDKVWVCPSYVCPTVCQTVCSTDYMLLLLLLLLFYSLNVSVFVSLQQRLVGHAFKLDAHV